MLAGDPLASARQAQAAHTLNDMCRNLPCRVRPDKSCHQLVLCSEYSASCPLLSAYVWAANVLRGGHEHNRRPLLGHRHRTT